MSVYISNFKEIKCHQIFHSNVFQQLGLLGHCTKNKHICVAQSMLKMFYLAFK